MCCGGIYLDITTNKLIKVFFPIPNILIPVINQNGECFLSQWGQRESDKNLMKDFPVTGWARLESLHKDYWKKYKPVEVTVPFTSFFEKNHNDPLYPKNKATEFKLEPSQALKGILIEYEGRKVTYIVTKQIENWFHDRYPLVIKIAG